MCGLPGCGKSTYAKILEVTESAFVVCPDDIRTMLYGKYGYVEEHEGFILAASSYLVSTTLGYGSCIFDDVNITVKDRKNIIDIGKVSANLITIYYFPPDVNKSIAARTESNRGYDSKRWIDVINKMADIFEPPSEDEGANIIIVN
jgi:predicted kinase